MGSAAAMLAEARRWLGTSGRPNALTRAYSARNGSGFLEAPWCDIAVTEWARRSGNADAVLPAGDRAYTVWHAQDFQKINRWYSGTTANVDRAKPGDIVFFDWGSSNSIGAIDHVGVVEKVLGGGRLQTIEGNTGDACKRRVRSASAIAGYGRPAYSPYRWSGKAPEPTLRRGDIGDRVRDLQNALMKVGESLPKFGDDGDYGVETENGVKSFQRKHDISETSGVYGSKTAAALKKALTSPDEEDEDVRYYGQLNNGPAALTPISLHPGDVSNIGFWGDNGILQLPPAKLRVAVHDAKGWYSELLEVDSSKSKPWIKFRDAKTTDGISIRREDDGTVPIAWDAS
ncbi:peptidoglycan-binding protein [Spirillospora sp. NPDC047279]|uniref:peptidoglycan-binding protein n=1 Tax=Spirillospora sp. NPDC047279 TaxID=3155478 RepID=UPI0033D66171